MFKTKTNFSTHIIAQQYVLLLHCQHVIFIFSRAVLLFRRTYNLTIKVEKRSSPVKGVQGKHPPPLSSLEMDMKSNDAYDTHFNTGPQTRMTGDETGEVMDEGVGGVIYEVVDEGREDD